MKSLRLHLLTAVMLSSSLLSCNRRQAASQSADGGEAVETRTLAEARRGFTTKLTEQLRSGEPFAPPPKELFELVKYESPAGSLGAYLTPDPGDRKKHPAIIWITGGDCNTIGDVWSPAPEQNDQSAAAYRNAGLVMMFPALRGGNQNPGVQEKFLGEVDDVIAAGKFLASQPYVDPHRVYLGGHSTGGTLTLLVSEYTDQFRAVFSFGPVRDVTTYGQGIELPFNQNDRTESVLRAPGHWLMGIKSPTFALEGASGRSNAPEIQAMKMQRFPESVSFYLVPGRTHFTILAPANRLIAQKLLHDDGPICNIKITDDEINSIGG